MFLSAVSVLVVAQSISEIPEGLMNNPVYFYQSLKTKKGVPQLKITSDIFVKYTSRYKLPFYFPLNIVFSTKSKIYFEFQKLISLCKN